jgi:hypothetical protein
MLIRITDHDPEKLKRKIAQFYHMGKPKKNEIRLAIPGRGDYIFLKIEFERDKNTSLPALFDMIAREYWKDRVRFKYEDLPAELLADRWKALQSGKAKRREQNAKM